MTMNPNLFRVDARLMLEKLTPARASPASHRSRRFANPNKSIRRNIWPLQTFMEGRKGGES